MNRELLAKVRDRIAEVGGEHCDMEVWASGLMVGSGEPMCGTTACIAGHTLAVALGEFRAGHRYDQYAEEAARLLDLPSSNLFDACEWPDRYCHMLYDEGDAKGMLAVCDALLDGVLVFDADGVLVEADAF